MGIADREREREVLWEGHQRAMQGFPVGTSMLSFKQEKKRGSSISWLNGFKVLNKNRITRQT